MQDEIRYEAGDDVFVIDHEFEPVVQQGVVGLRDSDSQYKTIRVHFDSDPYDESSSESRRLTVDPDQVLHTDADAVEVLTLLGREDLITPSDYE
jgi:hypothetical protein